MTQAEAVVAPTDRPWYDCLSRRAAESCRRDAANEVVRLDEVNFWQPRSQQRFNRLSLGGPFFLRLKSPVNAIAGFGFFANWHLLPLPEAWRTFGAKNGADDYAEFTDRIRGFRQGPEASGEPQHRPLGCIILRDVHFLPRTLWVPWTKEDEWHPNNQRYVGFDSGQPAVARLLDILRYSEESYAQLAAEFGERFTLVDCDERAWHNRRSAVREGQGSFRLRMLDAYGGRCALTGERTEPVLEAAHIQPYLGPRSNHIQNGLLLRADLHDLYDEGYITVAPRGADDDDLVIKVSPAIRQQWNNGRIYYELDNQALRKLPDRRADRPSVDALRWHERTLFQAGRS